jgi:hypothetical protein
VGHPWGARGVGVVVGLSGRLPQHRCGFEDCPGGGGRLCSERCAWSVGAYMVATGIRQYVSMASFDCRARLWLWPLLTVYAMQAWPCVLRACVNTHSSVGLECPSPFFLTAKLQLSGPFVGACFAVWVAYIRSSTFVRGLCWRACHVLRRVSCAQAAWRTGPYVSCGTCRLGGCSKGS